MRKKNLILLTSITGLLLTLTPSQALAQESTTPTTSASSQDSSDKKDDNIRLASEDKCHWNNEIPVPENKLLKLLYDYYMKFWDKSEFDITNSKVNREVKPLKELVEDGKMSEKEAQYRAEMIHDALSKKSFSSNLHFNIQDPIDPESLKELVDETYDNPDNSDEIVQEIINDYSLKEYFNYIQEYIDPDHHAIYADSELRSKYQKEFDELDKTIDYDKNQNYVWNKTENFKVTKKLDKYSSDEEQVQRLIQLRTWLKYFPTKEEVENNNDKNNISWGYASAGMVNEFPDLLELIKEKGLDNDEFYKKIEKQLKEYEGDWDDGLPSFLKENGIEWRSIRSAKAYPRLMWDFVYPMLHNPDFEIPRDVVCDDEEDTPITTSEDTSTKPDTPEDKTTPTTKTTSKKDKPSNKTNTKSNDKSTISTTTNEDKEEESISTPITTPNQSTIPNQVKTPKQVNTPNTPNQEFTPINNSKPGTFNGGVSSSVEGEELSDGSKVDTGSPTTSIVSKIINIFS